MEESTAVYYQFNILITSNSKSIEMKGFYRFFSTKEFIIEKHLYALFRMKTKINSWARIYNFGSLDIPLINMNLQKISTYIKLLINYI